MTEGHFGWQDNKWYYTAGDWKSTILVQVMSVCRSTLTIYYEQLEDNVKKRYSDKLNSIGKEMDDPYTYLGLLTMYPILSTQTSIIS